jgi:hypothetical protein
MKLLVAVDTLIGRFIAQSRHHLQGAATDAEEIGDNAGSEHYQLAKPPPHAAVFHFSAEHMVVVAAAQLKPHGPTVGGFGVGQLVPGPRHLRVYGAQEDYAV